MSKVFESQNEDQSINPGQIDGETKNIMKHEKASEFFSKNENLEDEENKSIQKRGQKRDLKKQKKTER